MIYFAVFLLYVSLTTYFYVKGVEGSFMLFPAYLFTYLYWFSEPMKKLVLLYSGEDQNYIENLLDCLEDQFDEIEVWKPCVEQEKEEEI